MSKQRWLDIAEIVDAYRVFPRLLLLGAGWFLVAYSFRALDAVIELAGTLNGATDTAAIIQAVVGGVLGVTIPMVGQVFAKICDVYLNTGRKWDN